MNTDQSVDFSMVLASAVHDMKNSLSMLLGSLEEIYDNNIEHNPELSAQLSILQYEASRVSNDLIHLLGLYRLQETHLPVVTDEYFVGDFLEEQLAKNDVLLESRHISAEINCADDLNWCFDSDLIASIINNILVNTARYTKDKLLIDVLIDDQDQLTIIIEDNGSGYPEIMLENLQAYRKGIDFDTGSTHLGLYFADRVAALHCRGEKTGSIRIDNHSRIGGGRFTLKLP